MVENVYSGKCHEFIAKIRCLLTLDGDTLIFIDYRADRMRQITEAFGIKPQFSTDTIPKDLVNYIIL